MSPTPSRIDVQVRAHPRVVKSFSVRALFAWMLADAMRPQPQARRIQIAEFSLVPQEHPLGCAVACVASRCGISYQKALQKFEREDHAWTRGYYCSEVVSAFARAGFSYEFELFNPQKHSRLLLGAGTIIFVKKSLEYPSGHYLLRTLDRWMNPWSNFPQMIHVRAAFEKKLQGQVEYILHQEGSELSA
jgi:H+/Cl- antiporter ClcA